VYIYKVEIVGIMPYNVRGLRNKEKTDWRIGKMKVDGAAYDEMMINLYDEHAFIYFDKNDNCVGYSFPDADGVTVYRSCDDADVAWKKLRRMGFID
jgi:hypothetical protein